VDPRTIPPKEYPTTPPPPQPPPGSLLSKVTRPPSPMDICDFPYFDLEPTDSPFKLQLSTSQRLPSVQVNRANLEYYTSCINQTQDSIDEWEDDEVQISHVTLYSVIVDIATYGCTYSRSTLLTSTRATSQIRELTVGLQLICLHSQMSPS
jgi:hypothetical protein